MYDNFEEQNWNIPPQKKKKSWSVGKVVALTLACSLISGAAGAGIAVMWDDWNLPPADGGEENVMICTGSRS